MPKPVRRRKAKHPKTPDGYGYNRAIALLQEATAHQSEALRKLTAVQKLLSMEDARVNGDNLPF